MFNLNKIVYSYSFNSKISFMKTDSLNDAKVMARAIEKLLHPFAEVVIHDIKKNTIIEIYNNFSKRQKGDPSFLGEELQSGIVGGFYGPYEKVNFDGRRLKSVSCEVTDATGQAVALLCINLDISKFDMFSQVLDLFLGEQTKAEKPEVLFKDDWQERINMYVSEYLKNNHRDIKGLTKGEKRELVQLLFKEGAFVGKNAATYVGGVLNISRATVYKYLNRKDG